MEDTTDLSSRAGAVASFAVKVHETEIIETDSQQRYREKLARITLDSMVQFVGLLDANGTVLEINKVALDAVGITLADVEGKPFWTTFWWQVSDEGRTTLIESILRAAQGEFVRWDAEIYGRAGGKETIIIDASLQPVKDEHGNVVFITAEGRDITEKKAQEREIAQKNTDLQILLEKVRELDNLKTQFFSNVSHEFRTPLTLMLGPLEESLSETVNPLQGQRRERQELIYRNSIRLLKLVNTLLDFSRIEAGKTKAIYRPTDLSKFTQDLASVFRSAIEKAGLRLSVNAEPLNEPVYVDPGMWEKIILNLLSNALKFTFAGEIEVSVTQKPGHVEVRVRDTGVGIPSTQLSHVFERFHRIEQTRGRTHEGSGIGLALTQELVKFHGGSISVDSELEQGSTFIIVLPLGKQHLPADSVREESSSAIQQEIVKGFEEEASRWSVDDTDDVPVDEAGSVGLTDILIKPAFDKKILIVDDNADLRRYLKNILQKWWTVDVAVNGVEALAAALRNSPDLILSDVMMPTLDGFGLIRELKARHETKTIPVVLLSARAGEEARIDGLRAGADDYLVKPFSARELVARVQTLLELKRLRGQGDLEREKLHSLFMQAPIAICVLDGPDYIYSLTNDHYIKMIRLEGRDLMGRKLFDARPELKGQGFDELLGNVYRTGIPYFGKELPLTVGTGENAKDIFIDFVYQPRRNLQGEIDGLLTISTDVSEKVLARKRIEETAAELKAATEENVRLLDETQQYARALKEADIRKDEFIATLAHELRNPLAPIRNGLHILRVSDDDAERERVRGIMESQLMHMVHLIDDLLDISRITQGKIELRREYVSLQAVIQSAIDASGPDIEAAGHTLTIDVPENTITLYADMTRLTQIITNLLNNAAKYTPQGGTAHLSARLVDDAALITVSDNGIGILAEHTGRIFERFTQVDRTTQESQSGLGIGLALVKYLVEMHDGTVHVKSEGRGKGSSFTIRLPGATDALDALVPSAPVEDVGDRQQKILIVDDNVASAQTIGWMLELSGYTPMLAHDGLQTLEIARQYLPDTILLDIGLPGMNGYDVCRELRKDPAFKDTIIIAQTGWGQKRDRDMAMAAGFDHHLVKPIGLDEITKLLSETAKSRSGRDDQ
jgi:PAS domain S-box-containing protein